MNLSLENVSDKNKERIRTIMRSHGFSELKPTQKQAFNDGVLDEGNNLLVAETGNGKTLCAEALVKKHIDNNDRVAYLVPSTQLVNSKKNSIEQWIEDEVEVATGSRKYHHSEVVVATFNSFYQAILRGVGNARSFDLAILDDFHELYGSFIGSGLEKSIAAAKQYSIELFSMSATIGNPEEIASWLDADLTVSDEKRSIPIQEKSIPITGSSKKKSLIDLTEDVSEKSPILIFNYAKSWTETRAKGIADRNIFNGPDIDVDEKLEEITDGNLPPSLENLSEMIKNGVAYHHSSLPRKVRTWIEKLFKRREIECLCATTTIAYGFDSPVQSVIVADMKRQGSWVGKWEYQQWIGRAARPGYGYDEGYAYVLENDERTVQEEFFAPRELEPITTHIDSPPQFRKLILELVVMGWVTPEEIEEFVEETLYWKQMSSEGAWGRSFGKQNERLKKTLRETANWLEKRGFIREDRTSTQFESTDLGEGAVEFSFSTNISPTLSDIYEFYKWAEKRDNVSRLQLLGKTCEVFDLGVRQKSSSTHIESVIRDEQLTVNGNTITAGVLHEYWIENYELECIEKETQVNSAYLTSTSYRISSTLEATKNITSCTRVHIPSWLDIYSYRVQRGIELDAVPYVRNVRGLGRARVRKLKSSLISECKRLDIDLINDSIWHLMEALLENKDEQYIQDVIRQNVSGIGDRISSRIVDYHTKNHISEVFRQSENNSSGTTTINDFGN
jgi:helicase